MTAAHGGDAVLAPLGAGVVTNQSVSPLSACTAPVFPRRRGDHRPRPVDLARLAGQRGWHSLGGQAKHVTGSGSGVFLWSTNPYAIWVHGNDAAGTQYCDNWGIPTWGGWHPCQ